MSDFVVTSERYDERFEELDRVFEEAKEEVLKVVYPDRKDEVLEAIDQLRMNLKSPVDLTAKGSALFTMFRALELLREDYEPCGDVLMPKSEIDRKGLRVPPHHKQARRVRKLHEDKKG